MCTKEITFCLKTSRTLHLLTLDTHGLTLILELHTLQFLLTTKIHFLLTFHSVKVET